MITDPVTVTIDAEIGANEEERWLAQASARQLILVYDAMRAALIRDADPTDVLGALPRFDQVAFAPSAIDTTAVVASKAVFKALGYRDLDEEHGASDGTIHFNTRYRFDFDARDGVEPRSLDFESVAVHEIGHLLGFSSAVDRVDGGNDQTEAKPLDLFRFASSGPNDPTTAEQFTTFVRNMVPGVESHIDTVAEAWSVSTGRTMGDGNQASHWKDAAYTNVLIGVMDPTDSATTATSTRRSAARSALARRSRPQSASATTNARATIRASGRTASRRARWTARHIEPV